MCAAQPRFVQWTFPALKREDLEEWTLLSQMSSEVKDIERDC